MKKILIIVTFLIAMIITSIASAYAANYLYNSNEVYYDNSESNITASDVQGAIDELYTEATNYSSINTRLTNLENNFLDKTYPVGSIYFSTVDSTVTAVKNRLGGTWEVYGSGRTIIGAGTGTDTNSTSQTFAVNSTGGEYSHKLTKSEMPSHYHEDGINIAYEPGDGVAKEYISSTLTRVWGTYSISSSALITHQVVGGNAYHNIVQPYITVYMYKRIS